MLMENKKHCWELNSKGGVLMSLPSQRGIITVLFVLNVTNTSVYTAKERLWIKTVM